MDTRLAQFRVQENWVRLSAAYFCVGVTLFDEMVADGRAPAPKRINSKTIWDRLALDEAFAALPSDEDANPWDGEDAA